MSRWWKSGVSSSQSTLSICWGQCRSLRSCSTAFTNTTRFCRTQGKRWFWRLWLNWRIRTLNSCWTKSRQFSSWMSNIATPKFSKGQSNTQPCWKEMKGYSQTSWKECLVSEKICRQTIHSSGGCTKWKARTKKKSSIKLSKTSIKNRLKLQSNSSWPVVKSKKALSTLTNNKSKY